MSYEFLSVQEMLSRGWSRETMVKAVAETRRVDKMTARFIIAIELGEITGDVIKVGKAEGDEREEVS